MTDTARDSPLAKWTERAVALQDVLNRVGRDDLAPMMSAIRSLLSRIVQSKQTAAETDAMRLLGRGLMEVRHCVLEPRKIPDAHLRDLLVRAAFPQDPFDIHPSSVPPEGDAASGAWASSMLDGLASAEDDELGRIAASVSKLERAAPRDELGTLREPLAGSHRHAGAAPRVLMKGEINPGLLADLVQLFAQNAETGRLYVESVDRNVSVYFKGGMITDAECGDVVGERAFFLAMMVREGRFSYQRGVVSDQIRIFRTAQFLVMDTLRLMDEAQ